MTQLSKNRFLDSFLKFLLVSAVIHFIILMIITLKEMNIIYLNYFKILNINFFFKEIEQGILSQVISTIIVIIIYVVIFVFFTRKK